MAYTKTTWVNGQLPAINATALNKIEKGIEDAYSLSSSNTSSISTLSNNVLSNTNRITNNEAIINSLSVGEFLKGTFTPSAGTEYPATPSVNDSWYISGLTGAGYVFTAGDLTGQTADNFDKLIYTSAGWKLVEDTQNYAHLTGDESIGGIKTFTSPINTPDKIINTATSALVAGMLAVSNTASTLNFTTTLYTGNGTSQSIVTGIESYDFTRNTNPSGYYLDRTTFQVKDTATGLTVYPSGQVELKTSKVHIKDLDNATHEHQVTDSLRGTSKTIYTDSTSSEVTAGTKITSLNTDGFSVGDHVKVNTLGNNYVAYQTLYTHIKWGLTSQNQPYVEAYNPVTGENMILYKGTGVAGHEIPTSVGELDFVNFKNLSAVASWVSQRNMDGSGSYMSLDLTNAEATSTTLATTSGLTSISISNSSSYNGSTHTMIMYGKAKSKTWTIVQYQGTGATGNYVECGGKPARVILKSISGVGAWLAMDNQRGDNYIVLDSSGAEVADDVIDINASGFTIKSTGTSVNASGVTYIALVEFDTNANGGGSYFDMATDTSNLNLSNALVTYTNGKSDSNFLVSKESVVSATITVNGEENLLTYSEQFDNADWLKGGTVTATPVSVLSPIGTTDGVYDITASTGALLYQNNGFVGEESTVSIWVKSKSGVDEAVNLRVGTSSQLLVIPATGWTRIDYTNVSPESTVCGIGFYTGATTTGIYVWGAQLERGANVSRYIQTLDAPIYGSMTQGINYVYKHKGGNYDIVPVEPAFAMYDKLNAYDNRPMFDVTTGKWYNTTGGAAFADNFTNDIAGWTTTGSTAIAHVNGMLQITAHSDDFGYARYLNALSGLSVGDRVTIEATITGAVTSVYVYLGNKFSQPTSIDGTNYRWDLIREDTSPYFYIRGSSTIGEITYVDNISVYKATPTLGTELGEISWIGKVNVQNGEVVAVDTTWKPAHNVMDKTVVADDLEVHGKLYGMSGFDLGQKWYDKISERTDDIEYINDSGKPIHISVRGTSTTAASNVNIFSDGVIVNQYYNGNATDVKRGHAYAIIPNGSRYKVTTFEGVASWMEYR